MSTNNDTTNQTNDRSQSNNNNNNETTTSTTGEGAQTTTIDLSVATQQQQQQQVTSSTGGPQQQQPKQTKTTATKPAVAPATTTSATATAPAAKTNTKATTTTTAVFSGGSASANAGVGVISSSGVSSSGGMNNWEPLRQKMVYGNNLYESYNAIIELIHILENTNNTELPLLLSALLPAFTTILTNKTQPTSDMTSIIHKVRYSVLEFFSKLPKNNINNKNNEIIMRPHASHIVAVCMDVLLCDYEENAVLASRILFDLYKTYRNQFLPTDYVQTYLDYVISLYKQLPNNIKQYNFNKENIITTVNANKSINNNNNDNKQEAAKKTTETTTTAEKMEVDTTTEKIKDDPGESTKPMDIDDDAGKAAASEVDSKSKSESESKSAQKISFFDNIPSPSSSFMSSRSTVSNTNTTGTQQQQHQQKFLLKSTQSFRVLTECPLVVMLLFQLYPKFMKTNIPIMIQVMMDALALRPPSIQSIFNNKKDGNNNNNKQSAMKIDALYKRLYLLRARDLIAAQAKTLSFLTYLLRTFSNELKPYVDRLATNVITLMSTCPRESISTRKELLVATRHLLNSNEFRTGFYKHIDSMLDERVLIGGSSSSIHNRSDPTLIRPLAYTTMSDFVQHVRTMLSMTQMSKVVTLFSKILHDDSSSANATSSSIPLSTQYTAVRTLLSVVDLIYHNKDSDGQIGRDMLVRMLDTLVDKLHNLVIQTFPIVLQAEQKQRQQNNTNKQSNNNDKTAWLLSYNQHQASSPIINESIRDIQSMIRAIIVGNKTLIYYISTYRNQRAELLSKSETTKTDDANNNTNNTNNYNNSIMPPPGSNEEVSSAMLKITNTEITIIKRYIITAFKAFKLLAINTVVVDNDAGKSPSSVDNNSNSKQKKSSSSDSGTASARTNNNNNTPNSGTSGNNHTNPNEKIVSDQHRDALTYFAAAFTSLDGFNLRRSLGQELELMFDAIVDDPLIMVIPRHLLASSAATSCEFCSMLLDFLVDRMNMLQHPRSPEFVFIDEQTNHHLTEKEYITKQLHTVLQRPHESEHILKQRSIVILQLFERILKSLAVYPENESIIRRRLRKIVVYCLRSSLENVSNWPENYCMLLRYIFRSISAGKFEESYKELLPLIPTVLNGLYRVVCTANDNVILRNTAIELCLTIPARLSSLLPHMNLLLRIIIPALDSFNGDLVNLGLRTLEFWVDNLNPLFLYPEMSKQIPLFSSLMQALSRHLRPAPYPYGLLTLRLLGKLGGKNRQFLREPIQISDFCGPVKPDRSSFVVRCSWKGAVDDPKVDTSDSQEITIHLPLNQCLDVLKNLAMEATDDNGMGTLESITNGQSKGTEDFPSIWECRLDELDTVAYFRKVRRQTKESQAHACLSIIRTAFSQLNDHLTGTPGNASDCDFPDSVKDECHLLCQALLFARMIPSTANVAWMLIGHHFSQIDMHTLCKCLASFVSEPDERTTSVGLTVIDLVLNSGKFGNHATMVDYLISALCEACSLGSWERQSGPQEALYRLLSTLERNKWIKHEVKLINAIFIPLKTVPREISIFAVEAIRNFIRITSTMYGRKWCEGSSGPGIFWDLMSPQLFETGNINDSSDQAPTSQENSGKEQDRIGDDVFRIVVYELTAPQQLARFAARILLRCYVIGKKRSGDTSSGLSTDQLSLIRRVLLSRTLRLMPLPQQVGVADGLTAIVSAFPDVLPLKDQHLLACLSELLKMASVADGEMSDEKIMEHAVDKDGYIGLDSKSKDFVLAQEPSHSSALFFRRDCIFEVGGTKIVVPGEPPLGVQIRVSTIRLLHAVIRNHPDPFFDSEAKSAIGNIRPHVISLFFRSLASRPLRSVDAAQEALQEVLILSRPAKNEDTPEGSKPHSRLPKELLQTCIRPVLLYLREYTRLSVPLLRGLSRLLSLLSSWFNKTLGEKLLDHLQKWTDPPRILSHKIWREGEEPLVAAAVVDIFSSLPHAAQFVEHLVKLCIKLEATLPAFKARMVESPYRRPLARYLNKHPQYTVGFFFPRLKTPMYNELFQSILALEEDSRLLREYLSSKQCSVTVLNVCFERPLAIIRSEKSSSSSGTQKAPLALHGISKYPLGNTTDGETRPMNIEALESQYQGFRMVKTLLSYNPSYFRDHNDIIRAFRWLWRSRGRFLRAQHEDMVSPRFRSESKMLAYFLMNYAKAYPSEDLDILFELFRVFLQPSSTDFSFVGRFLNEMVTNILSLEQKRKVLQRFFDSIAGDTNEEIKVLGIQFLVFPMLSAAAKRSVSEPKTLGLVDKSVIEKFVNEIIHKQGNPISCGERLKVELLRLSNLFIVYYVTEVEAFREVMVKYCWDLLKSEDTTCKYWAYVVVCRLIATFETPSKVTHQVFTSLLRCHHPEGRDLVRASIDILIPSLPIRLSENELRKCVEQACQLLIEDGNSIPQLAHIGQTIVRDPDIFFQQRRRIVPYFINSLHRLGLSPTGSLENRLLAVEIIELVVDWEKKRREDDISISDEQADSICNFLVRLKLLVVEVSSDARGPQKEDYSLDLLISRIDLNMEAVLSRWKARTIRVAPIEKCLAKEPKHIGSLVACLQLMTMFLKVQYYNFLSRHCFLMKEIIFVAVEQAGEEPRLQQEIRNLIFYISSVRSLSSFIVVALEKVIEDACNNYKKASPSARTSESNRKKQGAQDDTNAIPVFVLFTLDLIVELIKQNNGHFLSISATLLSFAKVLSKTHLVESAAKQRQGSTSTARVYSAGTRYHTPTAGIMEESHEQDHVNSTKYSIGRARVSKDEMCLSSDIGSLVRIMAIFEASDMMFTFSNDRKLLFQIISSILEGSDNLQLLMATVRLVAKSMDGELSCPPFTIKEQNCLLGKISNFDFCQLESDVVAQPLADIVGQMVLQFSSTRRIVREEEFSRLLAACLVHSDRPTQDALMLIYLGEAGVSAGSFVQGKTSKEIVKKLLWRTMHTDFEGLGARLWLVVFVDAFLRHVSFDDQDCVDSLRILAHGKPIVCMNLAKVLIPSAWQLTSDDAFRCKLIGSLETLLSKTYHSQIIRYARNLVDSRLLNCIRAILNIIPFMDPTPFLDTHLLVYLAENYGCWHEVLFLLEKQYEIASGDTAEDILAALRHVYKRLGENELWFVLSTKSCSLRGSERAISMDNYCMIEDAEKTYTSLVDLVESASDKVQPTSFEMDLWEERWILLQKELCQFDVVKEFAEASESPHLQLECAWKAQDWAKVRSLCSSSSLFAAVENGDPTVKMSETLLAVADGNLSDVENLHAQTAQLCLYKWQLLPTLSSGSLAHASLLHFFHRLVEIRESGQIMVETKTHQRKRTLPDLKNLLNAWRHRLPNDWENLTMWDEIFAWRAHMFNAITSNFHWSEPDTLATLHDRPWSCIRMAKTARKQGLRKVATLLLNKTADEKAMNVSDAFLKLREQILTYYNPESKTERHGGLNVINLTNLSYFDGSQKSELFRLKALFLQSVQSRSKANQAFCQSVQICPSHARAWDSWGELCTSLGAVTEKQLDQSNSKSSPESAKENATKVRQYLAQAMGCYIEAIQIDAHEWARIHIPKCLWMLSKDGSTPGILCQTFESKGVHLPPWVWLPWVPQLLTSLYRREGRAIKAVFLRLVKALPQAVYYPLRVFYLERRDVDRVKSPSSGTPGRPQPSVAHAEELMSLLRRSHPSLWGSLESVLEELIVKFRPSYEEELLATIMVLLERAETQVGSIGKKDEEESVVSSIWKTLGKIALKYFRPSDPEAVERDARVRKSAEFKEQYKDLFEKDFCVSSTDTSQASQQDATALMSLSDIISKLRSWKRTLEDLVLAFPKEVSMTESSHALAMFGVGDPPDLWPGSCDPAESIYPSADRECNFDTDPGTTQSTTSSSAAAAKKAAKTAAIFAATAARKEGVGGAYGGGTSFIEIPGQYFPNSSEWSDAKPSPELHAKLIKFEPNVSLVRRSDNLVRRIGMIGSDGKSYYFVLQFASAYLTRTDERMSQTTYLVDKVLRKASISSRSHLSVQSLPVIPIAQRLRLVSENESRTSLEHIHNLYCDERGANHSNLPAMFCDRVRSALESKLQENTAMTEKERGELEKSVRLEVFSNICYSGDANDSILINYLFSVFVGPEPLFHFRRMFAQQWAANCLLQYVFSAQERTPAKVAFLCNNGRVLSPEFRISYNNQGCLENHVIPFRLTDNLVTLIGPYLLQAKFITSFAIIAEALHEYRHDIDPIFRLLLRDDLVAYYTKSVAKVDSKTFEMEKQLLGSLSRNVATLHSRLAECSPSYKRQGNTEINEEQCVDQKVRDLVATARDPENLCMMASSFQGWL